MADDNVSDLYVIQRYVIYSINNLCSIQPDARAYDKNDLDTYEFAEYGYNKAATDMVDYLLAVQTSPANENKFKKRQGAKATNKFEQLQKRWPRAELEGGPSCSSIGGALQLPRTRSR